ncbi:MAG: hypothetical protein AAGF11_08460 [Myxococcota bacterium]
MYERAGAKQKLLMEIKINMRPEFCKQRLITVFTSNILPFMFLAEEQS